MRFIFILQKTKLIDFSAHLYLYPKRPHTNLFYFLLILFDIFFINFEFIVKFMYSMIILKKVTVDVIDIETKVSMKFNISADCGSLINHLTTVVEKEGKLFDAGFPKPN